MALESVKLLDYQGEDYYLRGLDNRYEAARK